MENCFDAPRIGVNYYPEDWPESEIESDIRKMKEMGLTLIRIGEFAWAKMEPVEGTWDFSWLLAVIERFGREGIDTIVGTPSATPPVWLHRKYPDAMIEEESGRKRSFGGRRDFCENHPDYRRKSLEIAEKLAQAVGKHPHVVGWQIDNEIYPLGTPCFCGHCREGFARWLQEKYGSIEALNSAWGCDCLFSQRFERFEDVPLPRNAWINPHIRMEWVNYKCASVTDFVHDQAEVIRKYSDAPIGTDVMPVPHIRYEKMFEKLDVVQFNHYNTPENLSDVTFWFDHLRTLKDRPFWNTETAVNWNGSTAISQSIKPEGFSRANTFLPVALGGEANLYWLWRTHWAGHELMHGAVLDTCGKPAHTVPEVERAAAEFGKAGEFLSKTRVHADCALHYSGYGSSMSAAQPVVEGLDYIQELTGRFHPAFAEAGLRPDVIVPSHDLAGYRLIMTPMLLTLEEADLAKRMLEWTAEGNTWVVGPLTDVRDINGAKAKDKHFLHLEEALGLTWLYGIPDREERLTACTKGGEKAGTGIWYDLFEEPDADVKIVDGYSTLVGKGITAVRTYGKGKVVVLGSFFGREELSALLGKLADDLKIERIPVTGHAAVAARKDRVSGVHTGYTAVETGGKRAVFCLRTSCTDLLSGESFAEGEPVELAPYGVRVLQTGGGNVQ